MSGGKFDYRNDMLCSDMFGYDLYCNYGDEGFNQAKLARRRNPMRDQMISELVWDVFCLMHSLDWALSSDTSMEVYEADVKYFKQKWFKPTNKDLAKREIDAKAEELQEALALFRKELYETFQIEE